MPIADIYHKCTALLEAAGIIDTGQPPDLLRLWVVRETGSPGLQAETFRLLNRHVAPRSGIFIHACSPMACVAIRSILIPSASMWASCPMVPLAFHPAACRPSHRSCCIGRRGKDSSDEEMVR